MIEYEDISKYKYRLTAPYIHQTGIRLANVGNQYVFILPNGGLFVNINYAWDGPSGPAIDTKNLMRASLIHDALYQLIREGYLDKKHRKTADKIMYKTSREDGVSWFRAQYVYRAVRLFGGSAI